MAEFYRPRRVAQLAKPRSPYRRATLALAAAFACASLGAAVLVTLKRHPRFAVTRVVLEGVPEARRAEVEELTDQWIGGPLLFVDLDRPIASLSSRPWVLAASARRIVPDTVEVVVKPNPPVALARKGNALFTVDAGGNLLGAYRGRAISGADDFVVLDADGLPEAARPQGLARGAAFVSRLSAEDPALLARMSEIEVLPDSLALVDQIAKARLLFGLDAGEPGRAAPAWRAYLALRAEMERHALAANEADLRFQDQIVLKRPADDVRGKT
jgi:cell division septal protein FtsQ